MSNLVLPPHFCAGVVLLEVLTGKAALEKRDGTPGSNLARMVSQQIYGDKLRYETGLPSFVPHNES